MTTTLIEQLEKGFEDPAREKTEPQTLAEAVSNELMNTLPRISPELFELKRKAKITLTPEQKRRIISSYLERGCGDSGFFTTWIKENGNSIRGVRNDDILSLVCVAQIPAFAYTLHDERKAIYPKSASISASFTHMLLPLGGRDDRLNSIEIKGNCKDRSKYCDPHVTFPCTHIEKKDVGELKVVVQVEWKAPYELDTVVNMPHIPESFVELGDEAIGSYYQIATNLPKNLRKKTSLVSPHIGVLWRPTDESLYVTGKIPTPEKTPLPKNDPALILDIPDGSRNYRHVVAVWNIGEELPFKNWLTEYSEGSTTRLR